VLVVVSGLPGTGKSTLAEGIGRELGAPVVSVDPLESALVRAGVEPSFETGLAAYLVTEACADAILTAGLDVIVDAVSAVEPARNQWRGLAARHDVPLGIIACHLDPVEAARRLARRRRGLEIGEPSATDVAARAEEWVPWREPHLEVDAGRDPDEIRSEALVWLKEHRNSPSGD
jgi:predicted kinase